MNRFGMLLAAAMLGSGITIGAWNFLDDKDTSVIKIEHQDNLPASRAVYTLDEEGEMVPLDFTTAAEKVTPAVVHIRSTSVSRGSTGHSQIPEQFRDLLPYFKEGGHVPRTGTGSGVLISDKGHIVTNNHVIDNADEIKVTLWDNRTFEAKLLGTDPSTDIAVIKIEEKGLGYLSFTDSENIKVGEWVLAVGNPYNLNSTVTAGIVSAKARSIGILDTPGTETRESIESFIQTDAAVNPGNSGGALVNLAGGLIGINTAIQSPTGSYSGYSFAVPSNIVSKVVEDILEFGTVQRGWLGVSIMDVNDRVAKENDLKVLQGAYINEIVERSGAKDAGMKPGDVIVEIDDRKINKNSEVIGYVGQKRPGDKIRVVVNRFGKELDFEVTLKNREEGVEMIKKEEETLISMLGAEFEEVDEKTLRRLDIGHGVRIKKLNNGLLKKETSMREGFIITHIAGNKITSTDDIEHALKDIQGGVLIEGRYEEYSKKEYYALGIN